MTIKIVLPKGEAPKHANGTQVFDDETGLEIKDIVRIEMVLQAGHVIEAKLTISVSDIENADGINYLKHVFPYKADKT